MDTRNLLLAATVFFHHGDYKPAYEFTFYPCERDNIYITGLDETNSYLQSGDLYFYDDEPIFILNPSFTHFEIRDKDTDEIKGELNIRWITEQCNPNEEIEDKQSFENETNNVVKHGFEIKEEPIQITTNSASNEILNSIHLYDDGEDVSHTLNYEPIDTSVPGDYVTTLSGVIENQEVTQNVEVHVEDVYTETIKKDFHILPKYIVGGIIVFIFVAFIIWLIK